MNAVVRDYKAERRLHLPKKLLGANFYPFMYGRYRSERIQYMTEARIAHTSETRALCVKQARAANYEALWYLRRIES